LKEEVVSLKMKLEKANKNVNKYSKFEKSSKILDQMMKQQRDSKDKSGLGYVSEQPVGVFFFPTPMIGKISPIGIVKDSTP